MRLRRISYRDGGKPTEVVEKMRGDGASVGSQETTKQKVEKEDWKLFVGSSDKITEGVHGLGSVWWNTEMEVIWEEGKWSLFIADSWMNEQMIKWMVVSNDPYVLPSVLKRSPSVALEGRVVCSRSCTCGRPPEASWRGCRSLCLRSTCCWLGALSSEGLHTPVDM